MAPWKFTITVISSDKQQGKREDYPQRSDKWSQLVIFDKPEFSECKQQRNFKYILISFQFTD